MWEEFVALHRERNENRIGNIELPNLYTFFFWKDVSKSINTIEIADMIHIECKETREISDRVITRSRKDLENHSKIHDVICI